MAAKVVEIVPGIYWVGVEDWYKRHFDAFFPLPYGTSYNSYLVKGQEKVALIDTVAPSFSEEFLEKVSAVVDPTTIDYLVMNHAEPDHGGNIAAVLALAPKAKLVLTKKGTDMAASLYQVPEDQCLVVKDGDTIDLGGKTLKFTDAPWLHWPETMFTSAMEDRVLFSCDFFASHIASDRLFDDEAGDLCLLEARRYYAAILMPYRRMAEAALDKAIALSPKIIGPSHGPVWRRPEQVIGGHDRWIRGPLERKVVVAYISMWGSTQILAQTVRETISSEGIETIPYDLAIADSSHIASDLVDAGGLVIGSPTVLGGLHPLAATAVGLFRMLRPRLATTAFVGSYGWGGGAAAQVKNSLEPVGFEFVAMLDVKGRPGDRELEAAEELGRKVARCVKDGKAATDKASVLQKQ